MKKNLTDISNIYGSQAISLMIDYNIDKIIKQGQLYSLRNKENFELNSKLLNKVSKI